MKNFTGIFVPIDEQTVFTVVKYFDEDCNVSSKYFTEKNMLRNIELYKCRYVGTYNGESLVFATNIYEDSDEKVLSFNELKSFNETVI
jgi:hypothetical protein